jgi:hypothetical protein
MFALHSAQRLKVSLTGRGDPRVMGLAWGLRGVAWGLNGLAWASSKQMHTNLTSAVFLGGPSTLGQHNLGEGVLQ